MRKNLKKEVIRVEKHETTIFEGEIHRDSNGTLTVVYNFVCTQKKCALYKQKYNCHSAYSCNVSYTMKGEYII